MYQISNTPLAIAQVEAVLEAHQRLELSAAAHQKIENGYVFLQKKIANPHSTFYGINTGFGDLCNVRICDADLSQLQINLVRSHACGTGDEVPKEVVRLMLFLKIQSLSYGNSGVQPQTVERLVQFFNDDALPVIYQLGSLGASGDLAPLAHLSLPLLGEGKMYYKNEKIPPPQYLAEKNLSPIHLSAKEGLALLNGTQFSTAYLLWCTIQAQKLLKLANTVAALSLDAFDCRLEPFDARLHAVRPHKGQVGVADFIRNVLKNSEIIAQTKTAVQDPYAFRCVPQVHGASADTIAYVASVVETEINAVTDNPTIFEDSDGILSGGNFHAQPIALAADFLAIALAELGSISERRTFQMMTGKRGLPVFLAENAGLNSGLMIVQYTAASIVSQNKQLANPASTDSIVSSNGQEDHVSMASNAGTKCYRVVENLWRILAIEWLSAAQALETRRPLKTGSNLEILLEKYRLKVPKITEDRIMHDDIEATIDFLKAHF